MTLHKPAAESTIVAPPPPRCKTCGIEMAGTSVHFSKDQCIRDLAGRVKFLRDITASQARELQYERQAIMATHRFAYAILKHFTSGLKSKLTKREVRVVLERQEFENLPDGVALTMNETDNGSFEVVGVVPDKQPAPGAPS